MGEATKHKRIKHFDALPELHELTFSCYGQKPLLTEPSRLEELSRCFDRACERHGWALAAFVFMPEHVHALVFPMDSGSKVADLLFAIKRPFSYRIKRSLQESGDRLLDELTVQQRPGVKTFRFWQEGPGYDRNITSDAAAISSIDYIHLNPVRRGLVDRTTDWRYSSAKWYQSDGLEIDESLPKLKPIPAGFFVGLSDATP